MVIKLTEKGIEVIIPDPDDREFIQYSIFEELAIGDFKSETKDRYLHIIDKLQVQNIEGIIFACTEIPILIKPGECSLQVFDTTIIHSTAAVDFALGQGSHRTHRITQK